MARDRVDPQEAVGSAAGDIEETVLGKGHGVQCYTGSKLGPDFDSCSSTRGELSGVHTVDLTCRGAAGNEVHVPEAVEREVTIATRRGVRYDGDCCRCKRVRCWVECFEYEIIASSGNLPAEVEDAVGGINSTHRVGNSGGGPGCGLPGLRRRRVLKDARPVGQQELVTVFGEANLV